MGGKEIIEIIKREDLLRFFFDCDSDGLVDYEHYTSEDVLIETEEDSVKYLTELGLQNYESKASREDTSEFWNVTYFPDHDVHVKISGWYDSYGGYEHSYDEIKEVNPTQVTKTVYN